MRYFRFKNTDKSAQQAMKEQYQALSSDERRLARKENGWRIFALSVTIFLFFVSVFVGVCPLIFLPDPDGFIWSLLSTMGKVILGFLLFLICLAFTSLCVTPLWRKVESMHLPTMKKEFLSSACKHLREYYGLQEPYIVTKCFDATDLKFKDHDICIFIVGNELRITTDLLRGFLHGERDLGCYAFKQQEITLSKRYEGNRLILEFKADDAIFHLGYRAKSFIEKHFFNQERKA